MLAGHAACFSFFLAIIFICHLAEQLWKFLCHFCVAAQKWSVLRREINQNSVVEI